MAFPGIDGMGFYFMSTSSSLVPGVLYICTEPGSADEGFVWDDNAGDFIEPSTAVLADCMVTMTQWDATLFQGRRYYADLPALGGSPGQVEAVFVNSANGAYLGVGGPWNIRSNTLQRESGFDPRVDRVVPTINLTWAQAMAAITALAGGTVTPEENTPSANQTRYQFKLSDGSAYLTLVYDDATSGKRLTATLPSF